MIRNILSCGILALPCSALANEPGLVATIYAESEPRGNWAYTEPTGIPVAEMVDTAIPTFSYANLEADSQIREIMSSSYVSIEWSGLMTFSEAGQHAVAITRYKPKTNRSVRVNSCEFYFELSGQEILRSGFKLNSMGSSANNHEWKESELRQYDVVDLITPFTAWLSCGVPTDLFDYWTNEVGLMSWAISIKGPSDRILKEVSPEIFTWE